ncbi:hypothetical protein DRO56_02910 [Candidatus Bathyarchaeota archaeon]|nr:MAG: hypothetical protein DRO56_02910 [Candidatus Bathyarchaeota archaeon]
MEQIADKFEEQDKHKLLLLTKGVHSLSKIDFLINKPRNQTIVSLSLNSQKVWKRWEHLTPPPAMRIEIAKRIMEVGYEVRIRIDPIFPIDNWKRYYEDLIYSIFSELPESPERITLGTPRGLKKTIMFSQDKSWTKWFKEYSKWGWKLAASKRKEIYLFFLDKLDMLGFDKSKISLCKETEIMWNELGMDRNNCKCNCVW